MLASPGDEDAAVQVVGANGRVLAATENLAGEGPIASFVPPNDDEQVRTLRGVKGTEGGDVRVLALRAETDGGRAVVYVSTSLEPLEEVMAIVRRVLIVGVPVLFVAVSLLCWLLVGRALAPVTAIRRVADAITARQLDRRVPEPGSADEIDALARTINLMLERIERSTLKQRRFVGADRSTSFTEAGSHATTTVPGSHVRVRLARAFGARAAR